MGNDNDLEMPPVAVVATIFKQLYKVVFVLGLLWLRVGDKWRRMEDVELRAKITQLIDNEMGGPAAHPRFVGDVAQAVVDRSWIDVGDAYPPFYLDGRCLHHDLLPMRNGVLDLQTRTLMPLDDNLFNLASADFDYDPDAKCPRTMEWWQWFCVGDRKLVQANHEWDAYCLCINSIQLQRYGIWLGRGGNSKQTRFALPAALCGNNISTVQLEEFADRFVVSEMVGKHIVQDADINDSSKAIESRLKKYCDGSPVRSERKYKDGTNVVLKARFMFGANKMIRLLGTTDGDYRRPFVFPCDAVVEHRIMNFEKTLMSELPGYLNVVLDAADRLRERGDFLEPQRCRTLLEGFRCDYDAARDYCKRCITFDKNAFSPAVDIYGMYKRWTSWGNRKPVSDVNFWHTFHQFFADAIRSHAIYPTKKVLEREDIVYAGARTITRRFKKSVNGWKGIVCSEDCYVGAEESEIVDERMEEPLAIVAPTPSPATKKQDQQPVDAQADATEVDRLLDELNSQDVAVSQLPLG